MLYGRRFQIRGVCSIRGLCHLQEEVLNGSVLQKEVLNVSATVLYRRRC